MKSNNISVEDLQEFKNARVTELQAVKSEREIKQDEIDQLVQDYRRSLEEDFIQEFDEKENVLKGQIKAVDSLLSRIAESEVLQ